MSQAAGAVLKIFAPYYEWPALELNLPAMDSSTHAT